MRGSSLGLEVYADADFVDKANNGRSVSGIAVTLGGTAASYTSKTQHAVSLSTSEAEYIVGGDGSSNIYICAYRSIFQYARDEWGK